MMLHGSFINKKTALMYMRDHNKKSKNRAFLVKGKISICYSDKMVDGFTIATKK